MSRYTMVMGKSRSKKKKSEPGGCQNFRVCLVVKFKFSFSRYRIRVFYARPRYSKFSSDVRQTSFKTMILDLYFSTVYSHSLKMKVIFFPISY